MMMIETEIDTINMANQRFGFRAALSLMVGRFWTWGTGRPLAGKGAVVSPVAKGGRGERTKVRFSDDTGHELLMASHVRMQVLPFSTGCNLAPE